MTIAWKAKVTELVCFNPCFGGSYIVTFSTSGSCTLNTSFNPCFGGSYIVTRLLGNND